jgi:glycosyltransferase involved in cell wall biosynthesis
MKKVTKHNFSISVIVPMRNSATTIIKMLDSVAFQAFPIREIIIVDNVSSDASVALVEKYKIKHKNIPITLLINKKNIGVGASYNRGVKAAKSEYVIFMHSDSTLPTKYEVRQLLEPFVEQANVVATYAAILHPEKIWNTYNFWMKCLMARAVGKESGGLNDKFDCLNKKSFLSVGGFDDKNYGHHRMIGAEDADLHLKLLKIGKVVKSKAKVIHLHYLNDDYSFNDYLTNRKLLARSYGRIIRLQGKKLGPGALAFSIIPALAVIGCIPVLFPYNVALLVIFSFWYMKKMYVSKESRNDYHILLLPFITIFLIYYETFWMAESFLHLDKNK